MSRYEEIKNLMRTQSNGKGITKGEVIMDKKFSPKIWVVSVGKGWKEELSKCEEDDGWSVPSKGRINDLILFYHNLPDSCIKDIFKITGEVHKELAGEWTTKRCDFFAPIERVARIHSPITFREMKSDEYLSGSQMILMNMNGRFEVTEYWDRLYTMIIKKNPDLNKALSQYHQ
jgi:hypothetical protein